MTARRPIQVVELRQPRCALRFGTAPCPATTAGGVRWCFNTWATCPTAATRAVFDNTGRMRWRFVSNRPGIYAFGDFAAANDPATHGIPVSGLSVSTSKAELNVGGILEGRSALGVRATVSISMDDFVWDGAFGDFYRSLRGALPVRTFWTTMLAQVKLFTGWEIVIYDGYEGEALAAMRQRLYLLDEINGPSGGRVTISGIDPVSLADGKRALFPPDVVVRLAAPITAAATTIQVVAREEAEVSAILGLTAKRFIRIGSEVIEYTGYTVVSPGLYDLTGCIRGQGGTVAAAAAFEARVGRVGHFDNAILADSAEYLLAQRTQIGAGRIDTAGWTFERRWLDTYRCTTFIAEPNAVLDLVAEICQQGAMSVWWDEYAQKVRMQAIRPPQGTPPVLDDDTAILADSGQLDMRPESRLTRVTVFYRPLDVTKTDLANFERVEGVIEGDGELPQAGGEVRNLSIAGRWVGTDGQALQIISRIMLRYRAIPRFLSIRVSAKDRTLTVGDVTDVETRAVVDGEGNVLRERWQVISWAEVTPGEIYLLDLQSFQLIGRFGRWMAGGAANYTASSAAVRDTGAFWGDAAGLMPDGSAGYQWQ